MSNEKLQVVKQETIFKDNNKLCNRSILQMKTLQESVNKSITNGNDLKKFWNEFCKTISEKLWLPQNKSVIVKIDGFLNRDMQNSSQLIVPRSDIQNKSNNTYQSYGFSRPRKHNYETIITRKVRIYPTKIIRKKLAPMFDGAKYFYNKTVKYLIDNYFNNNVKFILDQFFEKDLEFTKKYSVTNESLKSIIPKINIKEKRINVKFNYIKYYNNRFKLPRKEQVRDILVPTKMKESHIEYWASNIPHHIKATACFEAYINYQTAITNYTCRLLCKLLGSIRTYTKDKTISFELPEFNLKEKTVVDCIGLRKSSLNFVNNTFLRNYTKNIPYKIDAIEKSRCMRLIDGDVKRISDSQLMLVNNEYYLCLALKSTISLAKPKFNTVAVDPGVRTFQTLYSPDGVVAKLGNGYNQLLVGMCKRIDNYQSYHNEFSQPIPVILTEDQKKIIKKKKRTRYRLRKRMKRTWKKVKNITEQLHKVTAKYLVDNFEHILIPDTNISNMVKSYKRNINKTTVRGLMCLSHYKFRERLKQLADRKGNIVTEVSEAYTSKTCGLCGYINEELGGQKIFTCSKCKYKCDRDIHGARNIYIRAVNNIWGRSPL